MPEPENFDWEAELAEGGGVPEDDIPDPGRTLNMSMEETGWNRQAQELAWLLATAIERLGGALVITREERLRATRYSLGFDVKFETETDGIRIFAVLKGDDE
jgi:hypothetical protein